MSTQDVFKTYYALRGCLIKERLGRNSVLVFQLNIQLELFVNCDNIENHPEVLKYFQIYHLEIPLCHTLSKAFDISKKTPLTSSPSSNH